MAEDVKKKKNLFTTEREPLASPATAHVKTCTTLAHIRPPASGIPGCEIAVPKPDIQQAALQNKNFTTHTLHS